MSWLKTNINYSYKAITGFFVSDMPSLMRKDTEVNFYESSCHLILSNWTGFQGGHKQFVDTELKGSCTELQVV